MPLRLAPLAPLALASLLGCSAAPAPRSRATATAHAAPRSAAPEPPTTPHGGRGFEKVATWRVADLAVASFAEHRTDVSNPDDLHVEVAGWRPLDEGMRHAYLRPVGAPLSLLEIGGQSRTHRDPFVEPSDGLSVRCGGKLRDVTPQDVWWTTVAPAPSGADVVVSEGWFLETSCTVVGGRRTFVRARVVSSEPPILAFRVPPSLRKEAAMGLVLPRALGIAAEGLAPKDIHTGAFTFVLVPLLRGRFVSILAAFAGLDVAGFETVLGLPARADAAALATVDLELSQTAGEAEPVVTAFVSRMEEVDAEHDP